MHKFTHDQLKRSAELIVETQMASVSMIQRKIKLGYNTASAIMDALENLSIVGAFKGGKPRQVLIQDQKEVNEIINQL